MPEELDIPPAAPEAQSGGRSPAYALEAEQSVLGALILDNGVMDLVADQLAEDDFYVGAHRALYRAITNLLDRGEPADPVTLQQYLQKNEELEAVGGVGYAARLMETVPSAANAAAYARVVHEMAVRRSLARAATAIAEQAYQQQVPVNQLLEQSEREIFLVGEKQAQRRAEYQPLKAVLVPVMDRIEQMMERKEQVTGVPTGFIDLDQMLSGLQPADLLILAGRPSMGKTALALNMAANAAIEHQVPVAIFSLEMSKEQLASRLFAATARVDASSLRTGHIRDDEYGRIVQASELLSRAPIYIDETPALAISALRAKCRRMKRELGLGLVVVDYLQLMQGSPRRGEVNRVQEITEISQGLKAVAKELGVPVIALSQLSRSVESRPDKRPILSDLRESGSIEQDADVVMFVYRGEYYNREDPSLKGIAELIVAKHRNGAVGAVKLSFLHTITRFENLSQREA